MEMWINDGIWYCGDCEINFKVYVEGDEPTVNFCPSCANRALRLIEEED